MSSHTSRSILEQSDPVPAGFVYESESTPKSWDGFRVYDHWRDPIGNRFSFFNREKTLAERQKRGLATIEFD